MQRPRRFEGSHLGEADLILALIAGIVDDAAALARVADRARPERGAGGCVTRLRTRSRASSATGTTTEVLERVFVWAHVLLILGFLAYLPHSKHLHIATAAINVFFGRTRARGRLEPLDFEAEDEADAPLRRRHRRRPDVEADARHDVVHRVRPLPGRLPRLRDRQGALAEAPDHGPPGPALRRGPGGARRRRARPPLVPNAVTDDVVWDCVTCGACVHECPVVDRARRPHRRPPPPSRDGRVALPGRGRRRCSATSSARRIRGASRRPSAPTGRTSSACACSSRATRHPRSSTGSAAPRRSTSGRAPSAVVDGEAAARGRARRRHPRPARVVHRRPRAAHGQRVRVPGVRRARTSRR